MKNFFTRSRAWALAHKAVSVLVLVALLSGVYGTWKAVASGSSVTRYAIAEAAVGTVTATVTGTGQVSTSNEVALAPKASGTITSVRVKNGDKVAKGQVLATIDPGTAGLALQSAQLELARLTKPKTSDLTAAQNSAAKAKSDAESAVQSGVGALSKGYADDDAVIAGLRDLLSVHGGFLSTTNYTLSSQSRALISTASASYAHAASALEDSERANADITNASTADQVKAALADAAAAGKLVATAASDAQTAVAYIAANDTSTNNETDAATARTTVASLSSSAAGAATNLLSARQDIINAQNAAVTANQDLAELTSPDTLDLQTAQLNVATKQEAYDDYFVTAPFSGTVGKVDMKVGDTGGSATTITVVTNDQLAELSLNEVDAAKVAVGDKATITFDAIDGLTIAGTVAEVDQIGTVSSGVVNYDVQVDFATTDARVKPGMTAEVTIITDRKDGVVAVPNGAIHTQGSTSYVLVIPGAAASTSGVTGTPQQVAVTLGLAGDESTEIVSGLAAGDTYVSRTLSSSLPSSSTSKTTSSGTMRTTTSVGGGGAAAASFSGGTGRPAGR